MIWQNETVGVHSTCKLNVPNIILCLISKLKWYSYSGHLEKSVIETKLLEVRYDIEEKKLFEAI